MINVKTLKRSFMRILNFLQKLFSKKKKAVFFTKDAFQNKKYVIGDFSYGIPKVLFENEEANLFIGKYCSISENVCIFLGGNHRYDWITTYPFSALNDYFPMAKTISGHPATNGNVTIGNDVWISRSVTIMSGINISNGAIVGANSVVTKNIGPYEIWAGNPAKFIRKRFNDETISFLMEIEWWNWEHEKIIQNLEILCSNDISSIKNV